MLLARRVFAALGKALQDRIVLASSLAPREQLYYAAPVISGNSLERMLHGVLRHLSTKSNRILLSSFILGGKKPADNNLWYRLLIRLGDDRLIALAEPLVGLNLERVVDNCAAQGYLYTRKGIHFESRFRIDMAVIAESGRVGNARVHRQSIGHLKTSKDRCGDIDLLIKIGRTLLVGEVKCLRFPATATEIYNNLAELKGGCQQAARKARAVAKCLGEVLTTTGFGQGTDDEPWKVLPFVVSNQAIGVGTSVEGVPIVDRQILDSYLDQGGYYPTAQLGTDGTIWDKGPFNSFYADEIEAEEHIEKYLRNPPAVSRYEPFFELRRISLDQLGYPLVIESSHLNVEKLDATIPGGSA